MAKRSNKLSQTMDLPLNKIMSMSRAELAKATQTLAKAGNRRLTTLKKARITTPASEYNKKHGGKFSTRNKNIYELRTEFQRAKTFLETKTSTITGFREFERNVAITLEDKTATYATDAKGNKLKDEQGNFIKLKAGIDYNSLNKSEKRKFWKAFAKLHELDPANTLSGTANYKTSLNEIYDAVKSGLLMRDIDAFANALNDELYAKSPKQFNPFTTLKGNYEG